MRREDFIDLIKVVESVLIINNACETLTGNCLDAGECSYVFLLWDILRRNCKEQYHETSNLTEDVRRNNAFTEILESKEMSPEEKYELLFD